MKFSTSRTKCSFWCSHLSRLESLVFLWLRRVYKGSRKTSPFRRFPSMSFCVAGVALCDIPTCLITCRKCQTWRKFCTKCSFFCTHVSRLESLVFLWLRRVYGGSCKTSAKPLLFEDFQAGCHAVLRGRRGAL